MGSAKVDNILKNSVYIHVSDLPDPTLKAMHQLYIPISLYFLLYLILLTLDFVYFDEGFF